ncbi:hypothetical protein KPL70_013956 [Citrus sinensis]|nr:hypothetical protein KPL70_013956 [Citrus sinensis]
MKKRSETWNHYTVLEDNQYKAKCNCCGKIYQCHSRFDGISNVGTHLKVCEAYLNVKREQDERQQKLAAESGEGNASNMVLAKGWSQEACRRAASKMIILGELPLNFVDNKGFRHFCNVVIPQFIRPSRRTISRDVMDMFLEEKEILKSLICKNKHRVSLTTDIWTSVQNMSYMGIERVCAITVDNASGNDVAIDYVKNQMLMWKNVDALVLRGGNSTYLMLMTALKFREAFERMAEVDKPYEAYFREEENGKKGGWNSSPPLPSKSFRSGSASGGDGGSSSSPHLIDDMDRQQGYIIEHGDDTLRVARPFLGYAKKVLIQNEGKLVTTDVERYLLDPIEDPSNDKLKILLWWKVNGSKYPILQKIARDILAIPVSTVASEFAFSTGGL